MLASSVSKCRNNRVIVSAANTSVLYSTSAVSPPPAASVSVRLRSYLAVPGSMGSRLLSSSASVTASGCSKMKVTWKMGE